MFAAFLALAGAAPQGGQTLVTPSTIQKLTAELAAKYGEAERPRIERGLKQAAGSGARTTATRPPSTSSCGRNFAGDPTALDALFARMESPSSRSTAT